jgi:glycosyltransferase involved in cell wall biosynthesis
MTDRDPHTEGYGGRHAPLVSIGVPVFNAERWLHRALDSLLAQQHDHLEIIICDNASQDGTAAICHEYARRDPRIRFIDNGRNLGAMANFSRVLSLATGQYFMWAAADDWWAPAFVSKSVAELEAHPDAGVCMTALKRVHEDGTVLDEIRWSGRQDPSTLPRLKLAFATAKGDRRYYFYIYGLYRRELLIAAFDRLPPVKGSDHLFVTQVALATRFRYVDEILHIRHVHPVGPAVRYADENLGIVFGDRWGDWKRAAAAGPFLLRSRVIPLHVKSLLPLVLMGFVVKEVRIESLRLLLRFLQLLVPVFDATVGPRRRAGISRFARGLFGSGS